MSKPVILRTDAELNMGDSVMAQLSEIAQVVTVGDDRIETIRQAAIGADLIFTCYAPITAEVIGAAKNLKGIVKYGVGVDSIDLEAATARGIPVVHCPDYGTDTVADQAFALMISAARKISKVDRDLRQAGWLWPDDELIGVDLTGKTLGLIGFGRIGKAMARRGGGFGMKRLVYDPYVPQTTDGWDDLSFADLDTVARRADFLSLHCVLTPETRGIINAARFRQMKSSAMLVNVSRGALIVEADLIDALQQQTIAGAGLDVFTKEPLSSDHPLLQLGNTVLSPHFAFYTTEAHERLEQQCLQAIRGLLVGKVPQGTQGGPVVKNPNSRSRQSSEETGLYPNNQSLPTMATGLNPQSTTTDESLHSEGDVNRSVYRESWQDDHLDSPTREQLQNDAQHFIHQSLSTPCLNALSGCEGIYLIDAQGRRIMDFHGNSAHQVGYGHRRVIEAIKTQLDELPFCPRRYTNQPAVALAEELSRLAPGRLNKVLFSPSGSGAIGIAMKLARYVTGRHETISMWDSFHGASLDAISIGGEALFRDDLGPLLPGCHHVDWPRSADDAEHVERLLGEHKIGAVIAEPMRCTTVDRPPNEYWQRVRELCDRHNTLLIFDEIPLALGRTGKMFCCEHLDVVPDILVIGKGLGGGVMPMAAVIVRNDLDIVPHRALGHYTHEKSPVGAAAALATIAVIEDEDLLSHATQLGAETLRRLHDMKQRHELISDVRGLGLALGIELRRGDQKATGQAERIMYDCLSRGLSFKVSGGNVLTLTPPLTISKQQMREALDMVEAAIETVSRRR